MADLRSRFIEDYAGGLLNVSRQELTSTGEVLSQDGLLSDTALFVEDGTGTKSGLKLGVSICESVDPTTEQGIVNVRYADRTYASIRDLKIFSTAIASAQAALSDAASSSISNLENAFLLLEESQKSSQAEVETKLSIFETKLSTVEKSVGLDSASTITLEERVRTLETTQNRENSSIRAIDSIVAAARSLSRQRYSVAGPVEQVIFSPRSSDADKSDGSYTVTGLSSEDSLGEGLDVTVVVNANGAVTSVTIDDDGDDFKLGDTVIIPGSQIGGGRDITLTVTQILTVQTDLGSTDALADQTLADEIQKLVVKVNEIIDILKN